MGNSLAILGGAQVSNRQWPRWPQPGPRALKNLEDVLNSGRWTLSCAYQGRPSYEQRFAAAFAEYCGAEYCVPTSTGSASLAIALEACDVGAFDEVVVPGLSWVASASAVLGINAVPVLVDVDPATYCVDPGAVASAITGRTRAITIVHAYSAVADLAALTAVARQHGIPLIEDCAHAHGATYQGRAVGTFGDAGAFSMQGSKLLTSGEGGAIITNDPEVADRAGHLGSDGRMRSRSQLSVGGMELLETGRIMGSNSCLSEFHAALLLDQLDLVDEMHKRRRESSAYLDQQLAELGCVGQATTEGTTGRTYYRYAVKLPEAALEVASVATIIEALSAELGFRLLETYRPLNDNVLYRPTTRRRFSISPDYLEQVNPQRFDLPVTTSINDSVVTFGHEILLAPPEAMEEIVSAFNKVLSNIGDIAG
ncbi:DegT/DnrJ/EryC1/StrS family aminotransferase [Saccharopolyspora gloriosae]|uniref:DegT/DnrJ/EryC1/StrS aminotransferase family protein n=1 Tax=Saccharopolyspora gloriosae TaxID=455344 RepID=UPI001FB7735B|nr:DegT/DnrJ/EryC1/StrS family aminotransferase [Saccharopolyspora gloriosae]